MADMNGVKARGGESLAEPERALVHVEAQTFAIGHHETSGGRALQLVPDCGVDERAIQLVHFCHRVR